MPRRPKKPQNMRLKDNQKQPVTTSRLPLVKCREKACKWSKAVLPGQNASKMLTDHYRDKHVLQSGSPQQAAFRPVQPVPQEAAVQTRGSVEGPDRPFQEEAPRCPCRRPPVLRGENDGGFS